MLLTADIWKPTSFVSGLTISLSSLSPDMPALSPGPRAPQYRRKWALASADGHVEDNIDVCWACPVHPSGRPTHVFGGHRLCGAVCIYPRAGSLRAQHTHLPVLHIRRGFPCHCLHMVSPHVCLQPTWQEHTDSQCACCLEYLFCRSLHV